MVMDKIYEEPTGYSAKITDKQLKINPIQIVYKTFLIIYEKNITTTNNFFDYLPTLYLIQTSLCALGGTNISCNSNFYNLTSS